MHGHAHRATCGEARGAVAGARRGTITRRYAEKWRTVRAFIKTFARHYGDEPTIGLALQPKKDGAITVAILVPVADLLAIRDAVAAYPNDPREAGS